MKTDDLISKLSSEHKEVQVLSGFWNRYLKWVIVSLLCVLTGVSLVGVREDWMSIFKNPLLFSQSILILIGALFSSALAVLLSVPSTQNNKILPYMMPVPFLLWAVVLFFEMNSQPSFHPGVGMGCAGDVFAFGVIPGIFLFVIVRQGATLRRRRSSFFAFTAAAALGALGTQFSCHQNDAAHLFVWHFLPILVIGVLGMLLARKLIKKL